MIPARPISGRKADFEIAKGCFRCRGKKLPISDSSESLLMSTCPAMKPRTGNRSWGKQGSLSSGREFAGSGFAVWLRRSVLIAAMAALVLLPIEVSNAGWLSDVFNGSSKHGKSSKHVASVKRATTKHAVSPKPHITKLRPAPMKPSASASAPVATMCDPSKFRIVLDVGHTAISEGATSARNVAEFVFNLRLARADRGEIEVRRLSRDQVARDRRQGPAEPGQARRRGQ